MKQCPSCKRSWEDDFRVCPIDGSPLQEMAAGADAFIGRTIGRCRVIEKLGDGELGPVYKGEEPVRGVVALQLVPREKLGSPVLLEAFGESVKTAARLIHPNVVRVHGLEPLADGGACVLMEYMRGTPLDQYRRSNPGIAPPVSARLVRQAAEGVLAAHRLSMIHGALHPSRVFIVADGSVKVGGFHRASLRTGNDVFSATPESLPYLAPEQIGVVRDLQGPDYRTDVYGLGVILYELLAGRLPFEAKNPQEMAVIMEGSPPLPPSFSNPHVSPLLARMVLRALATHPTERHASMEEFIRDLDAAGQAPPEAQRASVSVSAPSYPPPAPDADLFAPPPPPVSDPFTAPRRESVENIWPEIAQDKSSSGESSVFSWFKTRVGGRPRGEGAGRREVRDDSFFGAPAGRQAEVNDTEEKTVVVSGGRRGGRRRGFSDTFAGFSSRGEDMTGTGTLPRRRFSSRVYLGLGIGAILLLSIIFVLLYYSSSAPTGRLMVDSSPPGAQVYINETYRGSTPLPYTDLQPGVYQLRLQLDGYETRLDAVEIMEQGDVQRAYVLAPVAQLTPPPPPPDTPPLRQPAPTLPQPAAGPAAEAARFESRFNAALRMRNLFLPAQDNAWDTLSRWQQAEAGEASPEFIQARRAFCGELVAVGREKLELRDFAAVRELMSQARSRTVEDACYANLREAYDQVVTGTISDLRLRARAAMDRQNYVTPDTDDNALRHVRLMLAINSQDPEAVSLERDIFTRAWEQAQARSAARQHQEALDIYNQLKRHYPNPPIAAAEIDRRIESENRKLKLLGQMKVPFSVRVKHGHGRKYVLFGASECTGILRVDGFGIEYQSTGEHSFKLVYSGLSSIQSQRGRITIQGVGVPDGKIELEPVDQSQMEAFSQLPAKIQEYRQYNADYSRP